mmetsp:Transcript_62209/g.131480  ORF Transcript_62209/g.131480 Transcript_62209/m.131480 type:complete len:98 (+) Transcript_62209:1594-1887(+)
MCSSFALETRTLQSLWETSTGFTFGLDSAATPSPEEKFRLEERKSLAGVSWEETEEKEEKVSRASQRLANEARRRTMSSDDHFVCTLQRMMNVCLCV